MKNKLLTRLGALVFVIALLVTGCGSTAGDDSNSSNTSNVSNTSTAGGSSDTVNSSNATIIYGLGSTWDIIMPFNVGQYYSFAVASKIYDQLIYLDSNHEIQPKAAKSWEMEDEGKTIVFHLNENSKWHDGEPVTANDWVFTFNLIANPEVVSSTKTYLSPIEGIDGAGNVIDGEEVGVEARDDYTLVVHLHNITYAEELLSTTARFYWSVLPEHLLKDVKPADLMTDDFWSNPIGSGPYKFVSEVAGTEVTLETFDDYYLGSSKVKNLVYKVVDQSNMLTAMAAGEIDATYPGITNDEAASVDGLYDNIEVIVNSNETNFYGMSLKNDLFDAKVRKAINLAIDKKLMVDQLAAGNGNVAYSIISQSSPYYNKNLPTERDVDTAKKLVEESGWDTSKKVNLAVPAGIREKEAVIIQQNLKEIGIDVDVSTVDAATMFAGAADGTYDMIIFTTNNAWIPTFFKSSLDPEHASAQRPTVDTYYNYFLEIQKEQDESKRIEIANEFQELLYEENPIIPLFEEYTIDIRSTRSNNITTLGTDAPWEWTVTE